MTCRCVLGATFWQAGRPWIIAWVSKWGRCTSLISQRPPHPCGGTLPVFVPSYVLPSVRPSVRPRPVSVTQRIAFFVLRNASRSLVAVSSYLANAEEIPYIFRVVGDRRQNFASSRWKNKWGNRDDLLRLIRSASMRKSNNTMTFIRSCFLPSRSRLRPGPPARGRAAAG